MVKIMTSHEYRFKLYLKGYKVARNLYAEVGKTILYGPNAAGKTAIMEAIAYILSPTANRIGDKELITINGIHEDFEIKIKLANGEIALEYKHPFFEVRSFLKTEYEHIPTLRYPLLLPLLRLYYKGVPRLIHNPTPQSFHIPVTTLLYFHYQPDQFLLRQILRSHPLTDSPSHGAPSSPPLYGRPVTPHSHLLPCHRMRIVTSTPLIALSSPLPSRLYPLSPLLSSRISSSPS